MKSSRFEFRNGDEKKRSFVSRQRITIENALERVLSLKKFMIYEQFSLSLEL